MTIAELAATGLRGQALADAVHEDIFGFPRGKPAKDRTPEERRNSLEQFFAIMRSMTDEELADNPLAGRPLNVSILEDEHNTSAA